MKSRSPFAELPDALRRDLLLFGVGVILLWGSFLLVQRYHWGWESYYNYGWTVPVVGTVLLFLRWRDAPAPQSLAPSIRKALGIGIVLALVCLLPLRLMNEVNVFWRVPFLFQSWLLLGVSWAALALVGGRAWFVHFWFPFAFFLTFVPWPFRIEIQVIQGLTSYVTAAAVKLLHLAGYPAEVKGNTIIAGSHWLGVDQACSGIRSLQALTMVSLWLGEYFRLAFKGRILVVGGAVLLTGVFNLLRATGLTIATFHGGTTAYEKWHDPLGFITFLTSVVLLYFFCEFMGGKVSKKVRTTKKNKWTAGSGAPMRWVAYVMMVVGLGLPLATEAWFRYREQGTNDRMDWTLEVDFKSPRVTQLEIPEKVRDLLSFDYGLRCEYESGLGQEVDVYFYGYTGKDKMKSVSSYGHRPDICMTAQGARAIGEESPLEVQVTPDFELSLQHFKFEMPAREEGGESTYPHVFFLVWEKRNMGVNARRLDSLDYRTQLELLWKGRRDYARQVILLSLRNATTAEAARRHARAFLESHIKVFEDDPPEPAAE